MKHPQKSRVISVTVPMALSTAFLIAGCSTEKVKSQLEPQAQAVSTRAEQAQAQAVTHVNQYSTQQRSQQEVTTPWLAGKSVPLAKEVNLPAPLRAKLRLASNSVDALGKTRVTALTPECNPTTYTLPRLASCITALVGIPVRIAPDALQPVSQFAARRGSAAQGASAAPINIGATLNGLNQSQQDTLTVAPVDMELNALLDLADATWGVSHRLTENGTVEIYRLETRVLQLKALAQKLSTTVTSSSGFASESKATQEGTAVDVLAGMRTTLAALGTQAGSVDINADTKSVVVTDTPAAIERIQAYLDAQNRRLTRRVSLVFEELFVTNKQGQDVGVNWTVLYNKLSNVASPATLASANAAVTGINVQGVGHFAGTNVVVNALHEMGFNVTRRTFPISTLNGNAMSFGLPTLFDYVAAVTNNAVVSTTGTITAPTITQKEDRYGAFLSVLPDAQDDGQILVSINLADRTGTLSPYTVAVQGNGTTVQQRNIQEANLSTRTVLRAGVTQLVGGLDESMQGSNARRLSEAAPMVLGGSDAVSESRRRIILLVTAVAEDNI